MSYGLYLQDKLQQNDDCNYQIFNFIALVMNEIDSNKIVYNLH